MLPQAVRSEGEMENPRKTYAHPFCFSPSLFFPFSLFTSLTLSSIQYPLYPFHHLLDRFCPILLFNPPKPSHRRSSGVISAILLSAKYFLFKPFSVSLFFYVFPTYQPFFFQNTSNEFARNYIPPPISLIPLSLTFIVRLHSTFPLSPFSSSNCQQSKHTSPPLLE